MKKLLSILLCLVMVMGIFAMTVSAAEETPTWTKVTSAPTDWSGTYLIVYEKSTTQAIVLDSTRSSLDGEGNHVTKTRSGNQIAAEIEYGFTIAAVTGGYSIKSSSGVYMGSTANSNEMKSSSSTKYVNKISLNTDGSVKIQGTSSILQFNNASSNGNRFRYYKSLNQQKIFLYKLDEVAADECDHTTASSIWSKDDTQHWKTCKCGEQIVEAKTNHDYGTTHKCVCDQVEPFGAVTLPTGTFVIAFPKDNLFVTSTEYPYTSSSGNQKIELAMTATKDEAAVFTAQTNDDGSVTLISGGKYLYCNGNDVKFVTEQSAETKFFLEPAGYDGECFIKAGVQAYNKDQYLEYYKDYTTCYGMGNDASIYTYSLVSVVVDNDDDTPVGGGEEDDDTTTEDTTKPTTKPSKPVWEKVDAPEAGVAFKLGMYQETLGKVLYFNGGYCNHDTVHDYHLGATDKVSEAVDVYVEETNGGYFLYFMKDGVKTYIELCTYNATSTSLKLVTTPTTVYTWNAEYKTFVATVDGLEMFLGSYGDRDFFSASKTEKLGADNYASGLYVDASADTADSFDIIAVLLVAVSAVALGGVLLNRKKFF